MYNPFVKKKKTRHYGRHLDWQEAGVGKKDKQEKELFFFKEEEMQADKPAPSVACLVGACPWPPCNTLPM